MIQESNGPDPQKSNQQLNADTIFNSIRMGTYDARDAIHYDDEWANQLFDRIPESERAQLNRDIYVQAVRATCRSNAVRYVAYHRSILAADIGDLSDNSPLKNEGLFKYPRLDWRSYDKGWAAGLADWVALKETWPESFENTLNARVDSMAYALEQLSDPETGINS